jgi:hypothetical protein
MTAMQYYKEMYAGCTKDIGEPDTVRGQGVENP